MPNKRIAMLLILALVLVPLATAFAEEDLFDTAGAAPHVKQGIAHLKAKKISAAIAEFEKAAAIAPEAETYYYLGYAYYLQGKQKDGASRKKSREYFEKAYDLDPNFSPSRMTAAEQTGETASSEETATAPSDTAPAGQSEKPPVSEETVTTPSATPN